MTEKGKHIAIGMLVAVFSAAAPSAASAGTLLSGYGGPGQGSQAVLGSTLLGGSGKGSGGSSGGGSSRGGGAGARGSGEGAASSRGSSSASPASEGAGSGSVAESRSRAGSGARTGPSGHTRGSRGSSAGSRGGASAHSAPPAPTQAGTHARFAGYTAAQRAGAGSTLGISGQDLVYVIVVLAALVLTGVVTARMASARTHAAANGSRGTA
jgi:hypothetical protein